MGYGAAAEDERILSYSPKDMMTASTSTPPPTLPITVNGTSQSPSPSVNNTTPATSGSAGTPLTIGSLSIPPAVAAHTSRFFSYIRQTWDERRPWREFYSTRSLSLPKFDELSDRFAENLHVYRANYQIIGAGWLLLMMLGSLLSLLLAALSFFWLERWASRKAEQNNGMLSHKHKVIIGFVTLVIVWATGLGSYVVRTLLLTAFSIGIHASCHEPESLETEIATV